MDYQLQFKKNVPLAPLSTFGIGVEAYEYIKISGGKELISFLVWVKKKKRKFKMFAGGSNVVFPDKGVKDLVIQIMGGVIKREGKTLIADSGVLLSDVITLAIREGLSGLEYLSGIPGTIGGAVFGNAGAYGHSLADVTDKVLIWDGKRERMFASADCKFSYRESLFKKSIFIILRVFLKLSKKDGEDIEKISREIITLRQVKYKPGIKCPGSFFKNVLVTNINRKSMEKIDRSKIISGKIPAGYLLDTVGARGMRVGGIQIADFHGNLFVNTGGATARDVRRLASLLKEKVYQMFEIRLEEEIRYF